MNLDLTQFRQPETDVVRRYEPEEFEGRTSQFRVIAPVELRFKVSKDKDRYRLVGTVQTVLELTCSRCLEAFRQVVDSSFDIRYLPQSENTGVDEDEVEEDDLSDAFYRDEQIDQGLAGEGERRADRRRDVGESEAAGFERFRGRGRSQRQAIFQRVPSPYGGGSRDGAA